MFAFMPLFSRECLLGSNMLELCQCGYVFPSSSTQPSRQRHLLSSNDSWTFGVSVNRTDEEMNDIHKSNLDCFWGLCSEFSPYPDKFPLPLDLWSCITLSFISFNVQIYEWWKYANVTFMFSCLMLQCSIEAVFSNIQVREIQICCFRESRSRHVSRFTIYTFMRKF